MKTVDAVHIKTVDSRDMAWWAEEAHGFKGSEERYLVVTKEGNVCFKKEGEVEQGDQVKFTVHTRAANRSRPDRVTLTIGDKEERVDKVCDSLFWTESVIEKFFIPYYEAQRLLTDDKMQALKALYREKDVVALGHMPPSHELAFRRAEDSIGALRAITVDGMMIQLRWQTLSEYVNTSSLRSES